MLVPGSRLPWVGLFGSWKGVAGEGEVGVTGGTADPTGDCGI